MDIEGRKETFSVEVEYDPATGRIVGEQWRNQFGQFDRGGDLPAFISYCPNTGVQAYARWHQGGDLHRENDKPATIVICPETGIVLCEQYALLGHSHRDGDLPALIRREPNGKTKEVRYYRHGKLHRDPARGPAVERFGEAARELPSSEYWIDGIQQFLPAPAEPTPDFC